MDTDSLKLAELINMAEVTRAVNSYFRALDERSFTAEHLASIFTEDAKVTRPNGHEVSVQGSTATLRANLLAMHMWQGARTNANNPENFFVAGGVIHSELLHTDGQWKISQLRNVVIWRAGGFRDIAQTT